MAEHLSRRTLNFAIALLFSALFLLSNWCVASTYHARVMFHALNPDAHSKLEGIDPAQSIDVIEDMLGKYVEQYEDLSLEMNNRIQRARKSLLAAREHYLCCINLV